MFLFIILSVHSFERSDGPPPVNRSGRTLITGHRAPTYSLHRAQQMSATDSSLCSWMRLIWSALRAQRARTRFIYGV